MVMVVLVFDVVPFFCLVVLGILGVWVDVFLGCFLVLVHLGMLVLVRVHILVQVQVFSRVLVHGIFLFWVVCRVCWCVVVRR